MLKWSSITTTKPKPQLSVVTEIPATGQSDSMRLDRARIPSNNKYREWQIMITSKFGIRNSKFRWFNYLVPALLFVSANAYAINFDNTEVPGISNLTPATNQWNAFGVEVSNSYYYTDSRDTFDGQGVAANPGTDATNPARIDFIGGVTLGAVDIDYVTLTVSVMTINVYDANDALIDTISVDAGGSTVGSGSISIGGPGIAYLTFHDSGGTVAISTLTFTLGEAATFFTVAILPDTQMYVEQHPEILEAQMDWIVANQADENIIYVAHLGDLKDDLSCDNKTVDNGTGNLRKEWAIVNDAFTQLDAADIAYGVVPGNHDLADQQYLPDEFQLRYRRIRDLHTASAGHTRYFYRNVQLGPRAVALQRPCGARLSADLR